ncbi:bifunctional diguanylate cyclase/phosphodiesterase [Gracilibacillus caseinilyticus]|uniref:Bifunctional diguanylate cyclase/phosphodiesterase n=1 Tax=Gracilibacillus caseinilyticus TaxID=2932256 RepID=A0ABY4EQB5_9BACI|nr:bifunctional diguanylate cyclase/phosphodiesterase [Gracilibacillus caseinilyticus]UOQ46644.1 bifunctional diguanylate cyclase/phosphodiesterase [Gracilibacillus caseinilyticus]
MHKEMKNLLGILVLITAIYYLLLTLLEAESLLRDVLSIAVPVVAVSISGRWIYQAYRQSDQIQRRFWMWIGLSLAAFVAANLIWLFEILVSGENSFPALSLVAWFAAYSLLLLAVLHKIKLIETDVSTSPFLFNIFIFMIFITVICIHYLFQPVIFYADHSLWLQGIIIALQVCLLVIMFGITTLYYLILFSKQRGAMTFLIAGVFFHILAIMLLVIAEMNQWKAWYDLIDALWLFSLLLIGTSAKLTHLQLPTMDWNRFKNEERKVTFFPYLSVLVLMLFLLQSYHWEWNALSIGLMIVFIMLVARQLLVMKKNTQLVREYRYLAYHDALTGLKNRVSFTEDSKKLRKKGQPLAVLLMDLDRFKNINDSLGHQAGDQVLLEAAIRLRKVVEGGAEVYRIGGDEFIMLVPHASVEKMKEVSNAILAVFSSSFHLEQYEVSLTPSIGISFYPEDALTEEQLMKHADAAMYQAKRLGKNRYYFFDEVLHRRIMRKLTLEMKLEKAIVEDQFTLVYQPIVRLASDTPVGVEALVRWDHPTMGDVSPTEFIPVAEETGQIHKIGEWVLRKACLEIKQLHEAGYHDLTVAVNVSPKQLERRFVKTVENVLEETGLPPQYLELEIIESLMQNIDTSKMILQSLHDLGIGIVIDDFGTGYSSLYLLKELPIDKLKIDKHFIKGVEDKTSLAIVKTMVDIGANLHLKVVAEGIEAEWQRNILHRLYCDYGQGYYYSEPVSLKDLKKYIRS